MSGTEQHIVPFSGESLPLPADLPEIRNVNGRIIIQPFFKAQELKDENGWRTYVCGATGWNKIELQEDWDDVLVYVSEIGWNNGHRTYTDVGPPGGYGGIMFGRHNLPTIWVTARTPETAQRYHGYGGGLYTSIIYEDYWKDNSGGYVLKVRKR